MKNGGGLRGAFPVAMEEFTHNASEHEKCNADQRRGKHNEKCESPVIDKERNADNKEKKKLFEKMRNLIDDEHTDSGGILRNTVHQLARGSLGNACNGESLNLIKYDSAQAV